jgi:hypothetical protein
MTTDAVFEYPLADLGTYLALDSLALESYCGTLAPGLHVVSAWTFPTNDPHVLFVDYEVTAESDSIRASVSTGAPGLVRAP